MSTKTTQVPARQLTLLGFFAITASMVMAVYEYPTFATSGFFLLAYAPRKWLPLKAGRRGVSLHGFLIR